MDSALESMLSRYDRSTAEKDTNAAREVLQQISLLGLQKSGFFNHAALMGGTALRIFHGLDRFSEDLDFCLIERDDDFSFDPFLDTIVSVMGDYGIAVTAEEKVKSNVNRIRDAIIRGNTREIMIAFQSVDGIISVTPRNKVLRIKIELDTEPPSFARTETLLCRQPQLFPARVQDIPTMFAGKIDAVLCRGWGNRTKGRDLYDFLWYISRDAVVNRRHLQSRLVRDGALGTDKELDMGLLRQMLRRRFDEIDFNESLQDIIPFIDNPRRIPEWDMSVFSAAADLLRFDDE